MLTFSTNGLYANYNNESETDIWTAYVDFKNLKWTDKTHTAYIEKENEYVFKTSITNRSGSVRYYQLNNIPNWLTVSASSGKINPGVIVRNCGTWLVVLM